METEERKEGRTEAARQDWDREKNPFLEIAVKMRGEVLGDDGVFFTMDGRRVMEFAANIEAVGEWMRRRCEQERELLKANIARVRELEGLLGEAADTVLRCAIIDRMRVPVLHGRVAKTPDGRIHEIVQPATMMHEQEPVPCRVDFKTGKSVEIKTGMGGGTGAGVLGAGVQVLRRCGWSV